MKFTGKWLPEKPSYREACLRLSKDLTNFKRDPEYAYFVGNDTRGKEVVEAFDKVVDLPYVDSNDVIGNPVLHNGKSAGTLRYMKVAHDVILDYAALYPVDIVEIGGGYGGQRLVFDEIYPIQSYTIIDLPEAIELQFEYLEENHHLLTRFFSSDNMTQMQTDILISDYCMTEFDNEGMEFYLDLITFEYGYFTGLSEGINRLVPLLKERGFSVHVTPEVPKTSKHENLVITCNK